MRQKRRVRSAASRVSSHYTVDEDGTIYRHVAEELRAWHAGVSHWRGETDINSRSVGIEIVNPGHEFGYRAFPAAQIDAVMASTSLMMANCCLPKPSRSWPSMNAGCANRFPLPSFLNCKARWKHLRGSSAPDTFNIRFHVGNETHDR